MKLINIIQKRAKRYLFLLFLVSIINLPVLNTKAVYLTSENINNTSFSTGYWTPPRITLLSPNGGQILYQANSYSINWTAAASDSSALTIDLFYSTDGGATYPHVIATGEANDGIYSWTVPNIFSNSVKVKVVATDSHALSNSDESNANFSIVSPIVLNEFLPNPVGADTDPKPGGEWVELRNNGAVPVDVNGWYIYDQDPSNIVISTGNSDNNGNPTDGGETIVPAGGFLVVYRNGDADFELNNNGGDSVRLYNGAIGGGANLIDSYTYSVDAPENKSFARIPDGFGAFVDPIPTPGKPNVLGDQILRMSTPEPEVITVTPSPSPTATPTEMPSSSPTPAPSIELTPVPTPTETPTPTLIPTPTEVPTPSLTPSPTPTTEPIVITEVTPSPAPTIEPTTVPTPTEQ